MTELKSIASERLSELGAAVGIDGLALDDEGVCQFAFSDGEGEVYLVLDEPGGEWVIWAPAGEAAAGIGEATLRALLAANLFWQGTDGATLGLAPDGETMILAKRVPVMLMPGAGLAAVTEELLAKAHEFAAVLFTGGVAPKTSSLDISISSMIRG